MALHTYPYIQIVEDVQSEMGEESTEASVETRYKNRVNDIYTKDILARHEFDWLRKRSTVVTVADYTTGTVDITAGASTVSGGDTAPTWTSAMTGRWFQVGSEEEVYKFTFLTATTGKIEPAYVKTSNKNEGTYKIFQDIYELPEDYDRPTTEPGFYYQTTSGGKREIKFLTDMEAWRRAYTTQVTDYSAWWREMGELSTNGLRQFQVTPPPTDAKIIVLEYYRSLAPMKEVTTGTATTTANSYAVTLSSDQSAQVSAGQYFRIDSDGAWARITGVSGASLTLADKYPTSNSAVAYTICDAPQMPPSIQKAIFYGACWQTAIKQEDPAASARQSDYLSSLGLAIRTESRKNYGRQYQKRG